MEAASTFRGVVVIDRLMRPVGPTCVMLSKSACFVRVHSDEDLALWCVFAVSAGDADCWVDVIVWMAPVRDGFWFDPSGSDHENIERDKGIRWMPWH